MSRDISRKLAMLAGVPLALARNMPGAGPANFLILSMLTPPPSPPHDWVALIAFRYSMKKKVSSWARPPWWPCWLPVGGRFFFLRHVQATFPCLAPAKPHPASFRSFTPGASSTCLTNSTVSYCLQKLGKFVFFRVYLISWQRRHMAWMWRNWCPGLEASCIPGAYHFDLPATGRQLGTPSCFTVEKSSR